MHFTVSVIMPDNQTSLDQVLEPYDENLSVDVSRQYVDEQDITNLCRLFNLDQDDLPQIISALADGGQAGTDEKGIWRQVDYNLAGKWDYWSHLETTDSQSLLESGEMSSVLITPDGAWHAHPKPPIMGITRSPAADRDWHNFFIETLKLYNDHQVEVVDCHV